MKKILFLVSFLTIAYISNAQSIGSKNQLIELKGRCQHDSTDIWQNGKDLQFGTTTGSHIGTTTSEKIGFWGKTPTTRPSGGLLDALTGIGLVAFPIIGDVDVSFTDNTSGNVSTLRHGYFPKLDGNPNHVYFADGTWNNSVNAGQGLQKFDPNTVILPDVVTAGSYDYFTVTSYGIVVAAQVHQYTDTVTVLGNSTTFNFTKTVASGFYTADAWVITTPGSLTAPPAVLSSSISGTTLTVTVANMTATGCAAISGNVLIGYTLKKIH